MVKINKCGLAPAFPSSNNTVVGKQIDRGVNPEGITLRDYFAAHAPEEPQSWFKPVAQGCPRQPAIMTYDLQDKTADIKMSEHIVEVEKGASEYKKQRYIQWPYAWADEQIKQAQGAQTNEQIKYLLKELDKSEEIYNDDYSEKRIKINFECDHDAFNCLCATLKKQLYV